MPDLRNLTRRLGKSLRRWGVPLGAAAALVLLVWIDAQVKRAPIPGYCPENTAWVAAAEDFGRFYEGLQHCDAASALSDHAPHGLFDYELAVGEATGIRPTPLRWRVWMGNAFLAGASPEGVGFCTRPGVLLRAADALRRRLVRPVYGGSVFTLGRLFYGWRNGFLIVSQSHRYVTASLDADAPEVAGSRGRDELRVHAMHDRRAVVRIRAADGLPISGWVTGTVSKCKAPLSLPDAWPEAPLMSVSASRWADLARLPQLIHSAAAPGHVWPRWLERVVETASEQWGVDRLPEDWDALVRECSLAVMDVDTEEVTPVPEVGVVMRGEGSARGPHPLEALGPEGQTIPYEWNGQPGLLAPWLGEKLTVCLGSYDRDWLVTSQEPVMNDLIGSLRPAHPVEADVVVRVNWQKLAATAGVLVRKAADFELIPRMNAQDAQERLIPFVEAASELGSARLEGHCRGDRIAFRGFLARLRPRPEE